MRTAPRSAGGPVTPGVPCGGQVPRTGAVRQTAHDGPCAECGRDLVDGLTGVLDRQVWDGRALAALAAARDAGQPVALLLADLDGFKSVNDTYGHLAGDAVLRAAAAVLSRIDGAVVGRYGGHTGDEFLVLLPGLSLSEALAAARTALAGVRGQTVGAHTGRGATVALTGQTVSLGVAECVPHGPPQEALFGLLLDCDVALRAAKRDGGDQVRTAVPGATADGSAALPASDPPDLGPDPGPAGPQTTGRLPAGPETAGSAPRPPGAAGGPPTGGVERPAASGTAARPGGGRGAQRPREVRIPLGAFGHTASGDTLELVLSAPAAARLHEVLGRLLDDGTGAAPPT
ncbi:GGDEF domain-containing protein [Streptomyces sp. TRM70308]|uniref:GGDEF domain-containing protein n=1 Tax=Streptomyces sp. TRM70308 TaxID=3131932 RepID=UPI003CFBF99F